VASGRAAELGFPVERVTGIEPALSAWEADVLPLNYTRAAPPTRRRPAWVRLDIVPDKRGTQIALGDNRAAGGLPSAYSSARSPYWSSRARSARRSCSSSPSCLSSSPTRASSCRMRRMPARLTP
jgi:hypothetical protein